MDVWPRPAKRRRGRRPGRVRALQIRP